MVVAQTIGDDPTARRVCIFGRNVLMVSSAFWHFAQGHLLETFVLLHRAGLYHPSLRLAFGDRHFFKSWVPYLEFYDVLFDHRPTLDPRCAARNYGHYLRYTNFTMGERSEQPKVQLRHGANNSAYVRSCQLLSIMRELAATRRRALPRSARPMHVVLLARGGTSAPRTGPQRQMRNLGAVGGHLAAFAARQGATFETVQLEKLEPLQQVDLLLRTDILVSYHGSGVGAGHFWMPAGSVVVQFEPPRVQYCVFAVCGAASGKVAWIEATAPKTKRAEVYKLGGWHSKWYICGMWANSSDNERNECDRKVDPAPVTDLLFKAWPEVERVHMPPVPSALESGSRRGVYSSGGGGGSELGRGNSLIAGRPSAPLSLKASLEVHARRTCGRQEQDGCAIACAGRAIQVWA